MRGVTALDSTAMNALEAFHAKCRDNGTALILSHVHEQPYKIMKKAGFVDAVGEDFFCAHIDDALKLASKTG